MFASITSLLPSALHLNQHQDQRRPIINPDTEDDDESDARSNTAINPVIQKERESGEGAGQGAGQVAAKKEAKSANETFIFVRPPPSMSNHPLNIQVQLVPPNAKPPSGVADSGTPTATTPTSGRSSESSTDGASLARTPSSRSDVLITAYGSSTTSFGSVASSTTTSSSTTRRAIIPLYNLQAHNVMTNVIVDAGTDAKIAKFQKRGIELIDLAVLEPVEVWGEKDREKDARRESMRISVDETGAMVDGVGNNRGSLLSTKVSTFLQPALGSSRPSTPSAASSVASFHSQSHSNLKTPSTPQSSQPQQPPVLPIMTITPPSGGFGEASPLALQPKRNIFNKLFNKKSPPSSTSSTPRLADTSDNSQTDASSFGVFSLHPGPVTNRIIGKRFDNRGRSTPTPLPLTPNSPASITSQSTPTQQPQTPRQGYATPSTSGLQFEELISPVTITPSKEKGHGRSPSLASITIPFKTTLKNNRNRLTAMRSSPISAHSPSSPAPRQSDDSRRSMTRDSSPIPSLARSRTSQTSLVGSNGEGSVNGQPGYPLMLTQSQAKEELVNLKQQQLQLRPPVLGIQPSFVSSAPPQASTSHLGTLTPRLENSEKDLLQSQRALMYVWLVRKWLKSKPAIFGNPFGETGIFGAKNRHALQRNLHLQSSGTGHGREASAGVTGSGGGGGGVHAPPHLPHGGIEVRFEWKRGKVKEARGRKGRRGRVSASTAGNEGQSDEERETSRTRGREMSRAKAARKENAMERVKAEEKKMKRMSTGSLSTTTASEETAGEGGFGLTRSGSRNGSIVGRSDSVASRNRRIRRESTTATFETYDGDDDSDPEDSETPWICTLKVRRNVPTNGSPPMSDLMSPGPVPKTGIPSLQQGSAMQPQILRVKVGTMSPTPHHPKVVAMLKVPFPLPDIEVETLGVVKRMGYPGHQVQVPGQDVPYTGLILTAEEIKDVVCSTGLWLVVREGFGGVGKVSRKGDGWRIRA